MNVHHCEFIQYKLAEVMPVDDRDLPEGTMVLAPCACGELPLDELARMDGEINELNEAIKQIHPHRPLYHWSPIARRKQIIRHGFRPSMRPTTTASDKWRAHYTCFADTPSWAWALSGQMKWTPKGEWDLWETNLYQLRNHPVFVLPSDDRPSGIYEVRVEGRIFKRQFWYVGSRVK